MSRTRRPTAAARSKPARTKKTPKISGRPKSHRAPRRPGQPTTLPTTIYMIAGAVAYDDSFAGDNTDSPRTGDYVRFAAFASRRAALSYARELRDAAHLLRRYQHLLATNDARAVRAVNALVAAGACTHDEIEDGRDAMTEVNYRLLNLLPPGRDSIDVSDKNPLHVIAVDIMSSGAIVSRPHTDVIS